MEKRGFELAISTLVIILLGVILLIAIIIFVSGGFDRFKKTTKPLEESSVSSAIIQACNLACQNQDRFFYCCKENELEDKRKIKCTDPLLGLSCEKVDCAQVKCEAGNDNSKQG
ncbi:hypothetical protein D6817_00870 [Candidatus Pacearchaeota archaeon]|nr:MAG: hypothetical protein D6817_00870 [Candidatus Pacearchaeota archaeon]